MHPHSWQKSHRADGGRARLVSTPTHTKRTKVRQPLLPDSWFSDFAFRAQLNGKDYVDPCELTHVAPSTSRSTHAHVRIILSYGRSAKYIEYFMSYVKKGLEIRTHRFSFRYVVDDSSFQAAISLAHMDAHVERLFWILEQSSPNAKLRSF